MGFIQSSKDLNTILPPASAIRPRLQDSLVTCGDTFNLAPTHRSNLEADIYMCTPMSLERRGPHHVGLPGHQTEAEPTEVGESLGWRNMEFSLSQQLYGGEALENAQFLEMYEGDYIGGALGYFAPFEITTLDETLTAGVFGGDKGQQNSREFGTQS